MVSPREYNFETDRIFAFTSKRALRECWRKVGKEALRETIKEQCTSYDGFRSHYSNNLDVWLSEQGKPWERWDHNQLYILIGCLVQQYFEIRDSYWQSEMMEGYRDNGHYDDWLWDAMDEQGRDLVNCLSDVRRIREDRQYSRRKSIEILREYLTEDAEKRLLAIAAKAPTESTEAESAYVRAMSELMSAAQAPLLAILQPKLPFEPVTQGDTDASVPD